MPVHELTKAPKKLSNAHIILCKSTMSFWEQTTTITNISSYAQMLTVYSLLVKHQCLGNNIIHRDKVQVARLVEKNFSNVIFPGL